MKRLVPAISCLSFALALPLMAQDLPVVRKGTTEVAGFLGASYGIDEFRVMGGGNLAYAVTREIMPYAEYSYFPGIGRKDLVTGTNFVYSAPLSDVHVGIHVRIPIKEHRVVPYLSGGVGAIHFSSASYSATQVVGGIKLSIPYTSPSESKFAANFGGGFRFYVSEKFGMRLEAKAYTAKGEAVFGKVTAGFFYQIH